jgi:hypothetical protein
MMLCIQRCLCFLFLVFCNSSTQGFAPLPPGSRAVSRTFQARQSLPQNHEPSQDEAPVTSTINEPLTLLQSTQTVGYRVAFLGTTCVYGFQLVVPLLQDAGLSIEQLDGSGTALLGTMATTCLLAPRSLLLMDAIVIVDGGVSIMLGNASFGIAGLCLREILYFGVAYKVEAVLCLATLALQLFPAVTALSLGVLVFGKFLEPLQEDWEVNESEFLATNKLE